MKAPLIKPYLRIRTMRSACTAMALFAAGALAAQAAPAISVNKTTYAPSEPITVTFSGGPGNSKDWIGIYPASVTPSGNPVSIAWNYTHGTKDNIASNMLTSGSMTFNLNLAEGQYRAWFLANDGYGSLVTPASFTVAAPVTVTPVSWLVQQIQPKHAVVGTSYSVKLAPYSASTGTRTFSKVSGPAWLSVAADGTLSGTPAGSDAGAQELVVRVSGGATSTADVPVFLEVFPAGQENVGRLSIMTYNLWGQWGNMSNGYQKGIRSIIESGADIVGMQESNTSNAQQVANDLGWFRASSGTGSAQIVSRYPIVETYTAGIAVGARIRLATSPVRDIIVFNCHLDYQYYGPYAARRSGATAASVLQEENRSQRPAQINAILQGMQSHLSQADALPLFFTGDFNAPSHLDWTPATAASHGGVGNVAWPASTAVEAAGLEDSFRLYHTDPAAVPGNSWSSIHKGTEAQDRIDFVYHKGTSLHLLRSTMFATAIEQFVGAWGQSTAPTVNNTWPSDHYSFVSTYAVAPVDLDGNGLADAWEQRWFQSLGNEAQGDANSDGLSNRTSMLLGLPPVGPSGQPIKFEKSDEGMTLVLSLSEHAISKGLSVVRSTDLSNWESVWSFDEDPWFEDTAILDRLPQARGEWKLRFGTSEGETKEFYRIRYAE